MKERPIIFSAPMVRAILDGRKTQTRRVVKPQPEELGTVQVARSMTGEQFLWAWRKGGEKMQCPYGKPGDRLWEISEADAVAEGCEAGALGLVAWCAKSEYYQLWDFINGKRGFGWERNPWVWAIEFKRIKP